MNFIFNKQDDRWKQLRKDKERCNNCMYDAPKQEVCCKHQCGKYTWCNECKAGCCNTVKLCEK